MATISINRTTTYAVVECCSCGVFFAMTEELNSQRRRDQSWFYCPNGHPQSYTKSESSKLREELAREKQKLDQAQADAKWQRNQREATERQLAASKGQITKIKKRVGAGVCPCCNRFFSTLGNHMKTKHPDYKDAKE